MEGVSQANSKRWGIFGGTFDPPHLGHLVLAALAQAQLNLDKVLFVLTADPPHKQDSPISPLDERMAMLEAALEEQTSYVISRVEIDRPGPHYALDTMQLLKEQHPDQELVYLIGSDSLGDLPTWHRPADFLAAIDALGVMRRPGTSLELDNLETELPGLKEKLKFIEAPLLEIASHEIRQRVQQESYYRYYLPDKVFQYIQTKAIYQ